jgi:hypothetical protein
MFQMLATTERDYKLLLQMFTDTMKPYIYMLEEWITFGSFSDPFQEFMIIKLVVKYYFDCL